MGIYLKMPKYFRLSGKIICSLRFADAEILQCSAKTTALLSAGLMWLVLAQRFLYQTASCGSVASAVPS